jgi:hypothetical protein
MIKQKFNDIRTRIAGAAESAGRNLDDIIIVPAVKGRPITDFDELCAVGITTVGESRVQEFLTHHESVKEFKWHFIGQLQSNKVKYIIDKVELIHSLDRMSLAAEIDRQAQKHNKVMDCLIELNIGAEPNKGGLAPDQCNVVSSGIQLVNDFMTQLSQFKHINIRGLMAVMPNVEGEQLENYYIILNAIYRHFQTTHNFDTLSAGMSDDYELAIKHGATILRLGRVLFG